MITRTSRSRIELAVNGRDVTIDCEALLPGYDSLDFVA
jgi:hypothetical protein